MMDPIKTWKVGNLVYEIHQDPEPASPRGWDTLGIMVCAHRRYSLGDNVRNCSLCSSIAKSFVCWRDVEKHLKRDHNAVVILPLFLYDHSGLSISTSGFSEVDSARWDWGQVGFIYVDRETIKAKYGIDRVNQQRMDKLQEVLIQEVATYDDYLRGYVYGYIIKDETGNILDSCWGYYGLGDMIKEVGEIAGSLLKERAETKRELEDTIYEHTH